MKIGQERSPQYYTQLRQSLASQAESLDETMVDAAPNSKDVFVKTSVWNRADGACHSTKENRELERRGDYMTYKVTTENPAGQELSHRRIQYFRQEDGSFRVMDFDGKSITETTLPAGQ